MHVTSPIVLGDGTGGGEIDKSGARKPNANETDQTPL